MDRKCERTIMAHQSSLDETNLPTRANSSETDLKKHH